MPVNRLLNLVLPIAAAVALAGGMFGLAIQSETPVGSLTGRALAQESGNPLSADIRLTAGNQKETGFTSYNTTSSKKDGSFSFSRIPSGSYTLTMNSAAHSLKPVRVAIEEGKTTTFDAELAPNPPNIDLYIHQHVFTPDERAQVTAQGFVDSDSIDVNVYKVDVDSFLVKYSGSLPRLLGINSYYGAPDAQTPDLKLNKSLALAQSFRVPVNSRDAEGVFTRRIDLPQLGSGLYVAEIKSGGINKLGWIMVTSLGLVTKSAGGHTLAYTTDLKTGAPVPGTDVKIYVTSKPVASGKTDNQGLLDLNVTSSSSDMSERTIVARNGESFAFVTAWLSSAPQSDMLLYAYTDRPVYRPGQSVYYKGIIRKPNAGKYLVPSSTPVTIEVRDSNDTLIYRATKRTTRFGCYSGKIPLNSETSTGVYTLSTSINGETIGEGATFQVAAYRKPEFSVKVIFPEKRYIRGDTIHAKIAAAYYFGSPVANTKVHYIVRMSPYWLFGMEDEEDSPGYEGDGPTYGEVVDEGDIRTDENGEAYVDVRAIWPIPAEEDGWDTDQLFAMDVTVTDKSDREATGSQSVVATRGEFAVDVNPDSWVVQPGNRIGASIQVMDYDKRPVKNEPLTVALGREQLSDDGESRFRILQERKVTTDGSGRAFVRLPATKAGNLRLIATARDSRGNTINGTAYIWSYSNAEADTEGASYPDLQIITDKKTYNAGDTARVLINTRTPGATALVTVEGDKLYDRRTVQLNGKSTMVEIPVRDEYKPNFYIGVCFVHNKNFASQQARAKVAIDAQSLQIRINSAKQRYRPGDMAEYRVKVTDKRGKPVSAELSLGVVDEAIYAIAKDTTPHILDSFYSKKPNNVSTNFSFPQIYLSDPDKAGPPLADSPLGKVRVRKRFLDTAYWNPFVLTDNKGEALVRFSLPDNLTTWRTTVRGITLDTACGESTNKVICRQDLMVRLEMPRFLVQSDNSTLSAIVHNYTGKDQNVRVNLNAGGLDVDGSLERNIFIRNEASERVDWNVTAPKSGTFKVIARATAANAGDAVQLDLPVKPHGVERELTTAGNITGLRHANIKLHIRNDAIPEANRLVVRIAPSLASALFGSLQYLAQYPYGCTEQTTSAFIPDVILSRSLKDLGVRNPKLEAQLPDMVAKGLFKLYRFQLSDGGWGWCEYGKADPEMTAYVLYGLVQARNAGFNVNADVLSRGLARLHEQVANEKIHYSIRAYGCYVLALSGEDVTTEISRIARRKNIDSRSLAVIALTFARLGHMNDAKTALGRLYTKAISEPGGIHWTGANDHDVDNYGVGAIEATAYALGATLAVNPESSNAYDIVRWLMRKRAGEAWVSTRDTAAVVYAMSEFLKASKELQPDYEAIVRLNGKDIGRARFTRASIFEPEWEITAGRDLHRGVNSLEIIKTGPGNLYYSARLVQYVKSDHIPATISGAGLSISRVYYKPSPDYFENSNLRFLGSPVTGCNVTETVLVRLTVHSTQRLGRLLLEDYIPAGCEIIDRGQINYWEWNYWYVGRDVRDDKISFYIDDLSPGEQVAQYSMRAGFTGNYSALPAQIFSMYHPDIRAATEETEFSIR